MARKRRLDRLGLFYAVVTFGLLAGGSLWLDSRGQAVVATVTGKTEEVTITHDPQGGWQRFYRIGAEFDAAGAPMSATVTVGRERYDELQAGDLLEIRYLPYLPLIARTPDRSTATVAADAARQLLGSRLLWWVACGALGMVIAARIGMVPIAAAGLLWMVAGYALLLRAPPVPEPAGVESNARVRAVTLVTKSPARRTARRRSRSFRSKSATRLAVPYQVIQLQVPVQGRPDSLLAVDAVDSGSVANLAVGGVVGVRHPEGDARSARLTEGTRAFVVRNRYHYLPIAIGLPLLGMLGAWGFRWRRNRARAHSARGDPRRAVATTLLLVSLGTPDILAAAQIHSGADRVCAESGGKTFIYSPLNQVEQELGGRSRF